MTPKECNATVYQQHEVFEMANCACFQGRRKDAAFFSHWHARMQALALQFSRDFFLVVEVDEQGNRAGMLVDSDYLKFIMV